MTSATSTSCAGRYPVSATSPGTAAVTSFANTEEKTLFVGLLAVEDVSMFTGGW